jgi:hypothetical protein
VIPRIQTMRGALGSVMKNYSIVRVGNDYVVQVGKISVLRTGSRRMALRLIAEANELLDPSAPPQIPQVDVAPSSACDRLKAS